MRTFKQPIKREGKVKGVVGGTTLPVHRRLAVFARQSTPFQVEENIDSREYQTEDLRQLAIDDYGWADEDIDVIDDDMGISASRKRIEQRPGMRKLFARIKADRYGAVLIAKVDRLFRDKFGTQSSVFTELCHEHGVLILTPDRAFNLSRNKDLKDFKDALEDASDFNEEVIQHLLELRQRASMKGRYDGRVVPTGYIVDRTDRKNKRYMVYESHARIVRDIFKRYRQLQSVNALLRELARQPYVFPEFEAGMNTEKTKLDRKGAGYGLGRTGLVSILTNPAYVGTWILRNKEGEVIAKLPDNHPAILSTDEERENFYFAFRHLSPEDLDGTPHPTPHQKRRNFREEPSEAHDTSLLADVITSPDGPIYPVTTKTIRTQETVRSYAIADVDPDTKQQGYKTYISMQELDRLFSDRLVDVVSDWQEYEDAGKSMYDALKAERAAKQEELMSVDEQLAGYRVQIANIDAFIMANGANLDEKTSNKYGAKLRDLEANVAALEREKREATILETDVIECETLLECVCANWSGMPLEKQRQFVRLVVREVSVSIPAPHFIQMVIHWRRPYMLDEMGLIFKRGGSSPVWTEEATETVRKLYPQADRETILRSLPTRSWYSIKQRAESLHIVRENVTSRYPLHEALSIADEDFMRETGYANPHDEPVLWCQTWNNEDEGTSQHIRNYTMRDWPTA